MKMYCKKFFFSILLVFCIGWFFSSIAARAATSTATFSVGLTIPATTTSGGGTGGGGGGTEAPPDNPPIISNVIVSPSTTSAIFTWSATDDKGITSVLFNYDTNSTTLSNSNPVSPAYSTTLSGLQSATIYYYKITVVDTNSQTVRATGSFTTASLVDTAPPIISGVLVTSTPITATVTWVTNENADSQVQYGLTPAYGTSLSDGVLTTGHSLTASALIPNTQYHYKVIATDVAGNAAATPDASFNTPMSATPPPDVSALQLSVGTASMTLTWVNPTVPDLKGVTIVRTTGAPAVNVGNGTVLYDGLATSFTDTTPVPGVTYYYTIFSYNTSDLYSGGTYKSGTIIIPSANEICGNGLDDNANGLTDCADPACSAFPACLMSPTTTPPTVGGSTTTLYTPPTITVPSFARLTLNDLQFFADNRQVQLFPNNTTVNGLPDISFAIMVPVVRLASTPTAFVAKIDGSETHQFALVTDKSLYAADFSFPPIGIHRVSVEVTYENNEQDHIEVYLNSQPLGLVTSSGVSLPDAEVALYNDTGSLADIGRFGLINPEHSNSNGGYGWVVPNGRYYIVVTKDKYLKRQTPIFTLSSNVINGSIELIPAIDLTDLNLKKVVDTSKIAAQIGLQKITDTAAAVQEIKRNPQVQQTVSTVIAPSVVGAVAVGTVTLASWANILSLIQFFFQPLLLLGRRKLVGWGQVYNSLNKLPIDLATVRLFNAETNQVVQSKVTDGKGRYAFIVGPGVYIIQAFKNNFQFPSQNLLHLNEDGQRAQIYHGERITINDEDAVVAANIPLDPIGTHEKPSRITWQMFTRRLKVGVSWLGLLITIASLYIAPKWYMWALLGVHIILFAIFHRLSIPAKIKSWGTVYDNFSKEPVGRVIARLFNAQFNKVVATQITDRRGRYYFLAGDNEYFVTYEHPNYQQEKTNLINLKGKDAENIAVDIALKKKNDALPPTAITA